MTPEIDLTRGGYGGDIVEETFKPFTGNYMEYWWHFREVLRPGLSKGHNYWSRTDKQALTDDEWRDLIILSLTNYAVYTSTAEAIGFYEQMMTELSRTTLDAWRSFEVRRAWKAMYSSLYTGLTALSNILCVIVGHEPWLKNDQQSGEVWNWGPTAAMKRIKGKPKLAIPFARYESRLAIRNQLDHYWTIWHSIGQGQFMIDRNYATKGYVALEPHLTVRTDVDAAQLAGDALLGCAQDINIIYKELAITGKYLDKYLKYRNWTVDYSDFGVPHNSKRPKP